MFFSAHVVHGFMPEHRAFFAYDQHKQATSAVLVDVRGRAYLASVASPSRLGRPATLIALGDATPFPDRGSVR